MNTPLSEKEISILELKSFSNHLKKLINDFNIYKNLNAINDDVLKCLNISGSLNNAIKDLDNLIKTSMPSEQDYELERQNILNCQEMLQKIDKILFSLDYDFVTLSIVDFSEIFIIYNKHFNMAVRFKPEENGNLLRSGIMGTLYQNKICNTDKFKIIKQSKGVLPGKIIAGNEF